MTEPLYRKSKRPFTEAEERMWKHLTEEANQVVEVEPAGTLYVVGPDEFRVNKREPLTTCYYYLVKIDG